MKHLVLLAARSNVVPWSVAYDPLAGILFAGLFALALLAIVVEVFVRSTKPRPTMSFRRTCLAAIAAFAALGAMHAAGFAAFAYRAKALYGGWPPVFQFYDRMQPWTAFFEKSEGVSVLAGIAAGLLAFAAGGIRRSPLPNSTIGNWHIGTGNTSTLATFPAPRHERQPAMKPDDSERRNRDTRPQPAWRNPATPCKAVRRAACEDWWLQNKSQVEFSFCSIPPPAKIPVLSREDFTLA